MIKYDSIINELTFGDIVEQLSIDKGIDLDSARKLISEMSFLEYHTLLTEANIIPPSGQTLGTIKPVQQTTQQSTNSNIKSIWPGKGSPVQRGMTVGLTGQDNVPVPGEITQVDQSAKGVKVKNPTTGQEEWQNIDNLQPFSMPTNQQTTEDNEIMRLKELAGMSENCSGGATGAGAIAMSPASMGTPKRRDEGQKKEYTRTAPAKTIIGDTKPSQASGELSATLAANGKKTASRTNNGFKK